MKYTLIILILVLYLARCANAYTYTPTINIGSANIIVTFDVGEPILMSSGEYCEFIMYMPENMGCSISEGDEQPSTVIATIEVNDLTIINYTLQNFALFIRVNFTKNYILDGNEELTIHYKLYNRPIFSGPAVYAFHNTHNVVGWTVSVYLNLNPILGVD
jgi:hypothetical protein